MGGTGGVVVVSMPLVRDAPAGRPTVGTLDVQETRVGSEICTLLTVRFWRPVWPGARWGTTTWPAAAAKVGAGGEVGSGEISYRGGVALAE